MLLWLAVPALAGDGLFVKWKFDHIQDGYDHDNRIDVFVDGEKFMESDVAPQSKPGALTVPLPPGDHDVRIVSMALYEGTWEEHTIANDYSIDCEWNGRVRGDKKTKLKLVFDIDSGTIVR